MKIQYECVPCLIKRVIFEAEYSTKNKKIRTKAIKNACKVLSEYYDPEVCSASIATKIHKIAYESLGDIDPYKDLKKISNEVATSLLPKVKKIVENSDEPLKTSMICSIVGNMMDFGIKGGSRHPNQLLEIFENSVEKGLGYDDYNELKKLILKSKKILFFTDNCGEIVFDKIVCQQLKKLKPDMSLTLVVKGEKILSDATMDDALELGFDKIVDNILTTGCFAVGVDFTRLTEDLEKALDGADLIICKGMANYESFSETSYRPIAFLLRTKCSSIANSMELPLDISAIKLYK